MDKKAEHATEAALTALDKLASLVEAKAGTGGMPSKLAKAIVRELDKVADQLELTMFGEESLLYRQASILSKTATVFPSQEAMDAYLKAHPNADKSKHSVDKDDEDTKKLKKDLGAFKDMQKGKEKSDKGKEKRKQDKGQKEDKAQFDKLKNDLESWRDAK